MIRTIRAAAGAALMVLALAACNPFDIIDAITTEVRAAGNKFLIINSSFPSKNATLVNLNTTVWLEFDRALDMSTVNATNIVFTPATVWTPSYDTGTKTLTLEPSAMESDTAYTVTVGRGLKGMDGNELKEDYTWSFHTKVGASGTVTINGGADYTTSSPVTLTFSYNTIVSWMRYSTNESDITNTPGMSWSVASPGPVSLPLGADGTYTVYVQFRDADDNNRTDGVDPLSDTIVLDHLPPTVTGFSIEGGAISAPTISVTLNNDVTDATSAIKMRFNNNGGAWSGWEDYSATKAWALSSVGTRRVYAEFSDKAGNTAASVSDSIIAGAPTLAINMNYHAQASVGNVFASWSVAAPDVGTDTYLLSWRHNNPQDAWTQWTSTTSPTTTLLFGSVTETILDFAVQISNPSAGGTSPLYSNVRPGFTSSIAIVYNDDDPADTTLATTLKSLLKNNPNWTTPNSIVGTMPSWTVTLVPQRFVSTTYAAGNRIWGYPLIVTPGITGYKDANWVHNLTGSGKGMIAMGEGGALMLDTISANWTKWFKVGQPPNEIGWKASLGRPLEGDKYTTTKAKTTGNTIWTLPLQVYKATDGAKVPMTVATSLLIVSVSRPEDTAPTGGYLYAANLTTAHRYDVVRQDRFIQFGFDGLFDRQNTGYPFFVNLANSVSDLFY
jgi:hypothetical protein